jgi:hypothetical protein
METGMGERAAFERWARENGDEDPPDQLVPAAMIFRMVLR